MKKLALFALIPLFLLTCRDPSDLIDKMEDDIKDANDLYLEIVDFSPDANGLYVNPGDDIRIEFDRAVDLDTIEGEFTLVDSDDVEFGTDSERQSLSYEYDEKTDVLTIKANPYLDGLKQYTVSILDGIRGEDGSSLRKELSWSFSTSDAPPGIC